jgi:hypothetical protein
LRTTPNIQDPLFISAPNGGGLLYAHRHLLMPILHEDATGLSLTRGGLLWCVQAAGNRMLCEVRQGQLHRVALASTPLDLHDVLVDASGTYVAVTKTNEVARLDDAFRIAESWRFGEEQDCAHVNCIAIQHGRLLASMFGPFTSTRGYKGATRQTGRVIDVRSGETLIDGLSQPHSLVAVGDQLWLCSSEDRALQIYDREFRLERTLSLPGYTRGLAVGANAVYVGLSRSRNIKSGEVGGFASAVVAVLDRQTLAITGYVPLPWNEIYDIRIATDAEAVTDVMVSLWTHERVQQRAAQEDQLRQHRHDIEAAGELTRAQAAAASDATAAWAAEVEVRMAAEQRAERQAAAAREATAAWAAENQLRVTVEQQAQTQAIEAKHEIVRRDARIHMLEQACQELQLIKSSRSWRLTRPLRFIARLIRHRGLGTED